MKQLRVKQNYIDKLDLNFKLTLFFCSDLFSYTIIDVSSSSELNSMCRKQQ